MLSLKEERRFCENLFGIVDKTPFSLYNNSIGEMSEWFKVHAWKACVR